MLAAWGAAGLRDRPVPLGAVPSRPAARCESLVMTRPVIDTSAPATAIAGGRPGWAPLAVISLAHLMAVWMTDAATT
jgi:hypothetical protein